jgi:hypothetical protein
MFSSYREQLIKKGENAEPRITAGLIALIILTIRILEMIKNEKK